MALAEATMVSAILTQGIEERREEDNKKLYEYYLNTEDQEFPRRSQTINELESEQSAIRARSPVTHIQTESDKGPAMAHILKRGEYDNKGEQVLASPIAALHPMPEGSPPNRLGLAHWLLDPSNPLTPRVTVNRFWQEIFGKGLVTTTEDFGVMGALPSHPELLDWLAIEFREKGWDVKQLFKLILSSATYRQAAVNSPQKMALDRDNFFLSRGPRYRMDAEMIRDSALSVSGLLSSKMYGPSVKPYQPTDIWNIVGLPGGDTRNYVQSKGDDLYRRAVYTFWKRMAPPPNLEAFNAPSREVCTVRRERTNTPLQALVTLNDPQFVEAARVLAQTTLLRTHDGADEVLSTLVKRVLGRPPSDEEKTILLRDYHAYLKHYKNHRSDAEELIRIGETPAEKSLDTANYAAWTIIGNQVLNLDEALNK